MQAARPFRPGSKLRESLRGTAACPGKSSLTSPTFEKIPVPAESGLLPADLGREEQNLRVCVLAVSIGAHGRPRPPDLTAPPFLL